MTCDTLDNDCDGTVDEGFDLEVDIISEPGLSALPSISGEL